MIPPGLWVGKHSAAVAQEALSVSIATPARLARCKHVLTGFCCSAEMINGTSRLLLRKETSLLRRNLEVGVETQMKNVIISSGVWLRLAPQAIFWSFLMRSIPRTR